jgi:hypothetical protein
MTATAMLEAILAALYRDKRDVDVVEALPPTGGEFSEHRDGTRITLASGERFTINVYAMKPSRNT